MRTALLTLRTLALASLALLGACEQKPVPLETVMPPPAVKPAKPKELVLMPHAVGPVTFGMPLAQVETALGEQAMGLDHTDNPECGYVSFKAVPKVRFMVENGVVTRAEVEKEIANMTGIGVGGTEAALKLKYPDLKFDGHKYVPGGHVLTIPGEGNTALVMETDGTAVTLVRAGKQPAVSYVEGCS